VANSRLLYLALRVLADRDEERLSDGSAMTWSNPPPGRQ